MEEVNLIVAIGQGGEIGKKGDLIWKISDDLKRFKTLTLGHPVIMGRKTWESLPKRPLSGRENVVLSRQEDFHPQGATKVSSVAQALEITSGKAPFIIGGEEIYKAFLPFVSNLFLTEVAQKCPDADAHLFINLDDFELTEKTPWQQTQGKDSSEAPDFRYVSYKRKKP